MCVVNYYSSYYGELINTTAVSYVERVIGTLRRELVEASSEQSINQGLVGYLRWVGSADTA